MDSMSFVILLREAATQLEGSLDYSERAMTRRDVDCAIASAFEALASKIAFEEGSRMIVAGEVLKEME